MHRCHPDAPEGQAQHLWRKCLVCNARPSLIDDRITRARGDESGHAVLSVTRAKGGWGTLLDTSHKRLSRGHVRRFGTAWKPAVPGRKAIDQTTSPLDDLDLKARPVLVGRVKVHFKVGEPTFQCFLDQPHR